MSVKHVRQNTFGEEELHYQNLWWSFSRISQQNLTITVNNKLEHLMNYSIGCGLKLDYSSQEVLVILHYLA